jgi:DNA-binding response OmpR family regulator
VGDLVLDQVSHGARLADRSLNLTPTEFRLMSCLASHPGKAFTRQELLHEVWDDDCGDSLRTINVHVQRLRAKLGPEYEHLIDTVRGVGYMVHSPLSDVRRQQYSDAPRPPRHLRAG